MRIETMHRRSTLASHDFGHWTNLLRAIIDAEHPGYPHNDGRWQRYFNAGYSPREALAADMSKSPA
jgi:hypothetical protein